MPTDAASHGRLTDRECSAILRLRSLALAAFAVLLAAILPSGLPSALTGATQAWTLAALISLDLAVSNGLALTQPRT